MKRLLLSVTLILASVTAFAQTTQAPVGQTNGGAINQAYFSANSDITGFGETAIMPSLVVPTTSTAQAAWAAGQVVSGTVISARETVITTCSSTTGVTLPAIQRYVAITIQNRSGGSCLIWPSIGATVETAMGTNGAVNSPNTMLTNTDVIFRPISATYWIQ